MSSWTVEEREDEIYIDLTDESSAGKETSAEGEKSLPTKASTALDTLAYTSFASYDIGMRHLGYAAGTMAHNSLYREVVAASSCLKDLDCVDILAASGCRARDSRRIPLHRLTHMLTQTIMEHIAAWNRQGPELLVIEQQARGAGKKQYSLTYIIQAIYLASFAAHPPQVVILGGQQKMRIASRAGCGDLYIGQLVQAERDQEQQATISSGRKGYRKRKHHGVLCLERFTSHTQLSDRARASLRKAPKKDDMGDALIQAAYALLHKPKQNTCKSKVNTQINLSACTVQDDSTPHPKETSARGRKGKEQAQAEADDERTSEPVAIEAKRNCFKKDDDKSSSGCEDYLLLESGSDTEGSE
jgi:hypothetical protein